MLLSRISVLSSTLCSFRWTAPALFVWSFELRELIPDAAGLRALGVPADEVTHDQPPPPPFLWTL